MQKIFVDGDLYTSAEALHQGLKRMLNLPAYYGMNADALYDCLSERREPVHLHVVSHGTGETAEAMKKVICVMQDLGGTVTGI